MVFRYFRSVPSFNYFLANTPRYLATSRYRASALIILLSSLLGIFCFINLYLKDKTNIVRRNDSGNARNTSAAGDYWPLETAHDLVPILAGASQLKSIIQTIHQSLYVGVDALKNLLQTIWAHGHSASFAHFNIKLPRWP